MQNAKCKIEQPAPAEVAEAAEGREFGRSGPSGGRSRLELIILHFALFILHFARSA
jgi:hypothetical protein